MALLERLKLVKCRTVLSMLVFWGQMQNYMMRNSINLIILAMVQDRGSTGKTDEGSTVQCTTATIGSEGNSTSGEREQSQGEFDWDEMTIGIVLSSFGWGYMATQIIGGRLAELYGFKKVYGIGLFVTALLMLLSPSVARLDIRLFIALRVLMGVAEGPTWPSMHSMTARWVPPDARSSFISQTYFGSTFGMVITYPLCGLIISHLGWAACFYIIPLFTMTWLITWCFLIYDKPEEHPRISQEELDQLLCLETPVKPPPIPILSVLTSIPFWGTLIADGCNSYGVSALFGMAPQYMKFMLGLNIKTLGFVSALPTFGRYFGGVITARTADWLVRSKYLSLVNARRIFNTLSQVGPAVALLTLSFLGCNTTAVVALLVVGASLNGSLSSGHMASLVDIAPPFAGTLFGVTNTFSAGSGILSTLITGALTTNRQTWAAWQGVFGVVAAVQVVGNLAYVLMIKAKPQEWSKVKMDKSTSGA